MEFFFELHQYFEIVFNEIGQDGSQDILGHVKFELAELLGQGKNPALFKIIGGSSQTGDLSIIYQNLTDLDQFAGTQWENDKLAQSQIIQMVRSSNESKINTLLQSEVLHIYNRNASGDSHTKQSQQIRESVVIDKDQNKPITTTHHYAIEQPPDSIFFNSLFMNDNDGISPLGTNIPLPNTFDSMVNSISKCDKNQAEPAGILRKKGSTNLEFDSQKNSLTPTPKKSNNLFIPDFNPKLSMPHKKPQNSTTFSQMIVDGYKLSFCVAIDFTVSNAPSTKIHSLHYRDPEGCDNAYQSAIKGVGSVIMNYDDTKNVPVFGFGAKVEFPGFDPNVANHCFPCNGNIKDSTAYRKFFSHEKN